MWRVNYVWKGETFEEFVIVGKSERINFKLPMIMAEHRKFFLAKAKARRYTNIRWRKL